MPKLTFKELKLLPDGIADSAKGAEAIKRMLGNLAAIPQGMAEIRNLYGTGHGKHGKTQSIKPRHAKLAVGAAATLATFLFETHKDSANTNKYRKVKVPLAVQARKEQLHPRKQKW